jgi:hypothetical protein
MGMQSLEAAPPSNGDSQGGVLVKKLNTPAPLIAGAFRKKGRKVKPSNSPRRECPSYMIRSTGSRPGKRGSILQGCYAGNGESVKERRKEAQAGNFQITVLDLSGRSEQN